MTDNKTPNGTERRPLNRRITLVVCAGILLVAALVTALIHLSEPTAERETATRETAMLVEVTEATRGTYRPQIVALGRVEAARDITLAPRVNGEVISLSDRFKPGEIVEEDASLLKIDPSDYENMLNEAQAALAQSAADLEIEKGRQDVARQEYRILSQELTGENKALVLREPQLKAARAQVDAARAAVRQAELDLARTVIAAPFNAQILSRNVNVGSQVSVGDPLGRLVGVDEYWVIATVALSNLEWISFPGKTGDQGPPARVRNRAAWPEGTYRQGHVMTLVGALTEDTRLARVLVTVPDPLALNGNTDGPALIIGSILEARIEGREICNVFRVSRDHVRDNDTVWIMEDGKLKISPLDIVFRDKSYAYVREGIETGDNIVTTNLATVADGAPLRTRFSGLPADSNPGSGAGAE